ncbi:hypothetical protein EYF80_064485 [Liparis tanakae]|uniref:Uncharacterized protein n=1 Tax=Liparis tanakae TaxID=230148 RepID=A0A4Z2E977_9TELE|nr:hypothetical protein EYF80_064485 [Liparis tanakae]
MSTRWRRCGPEACGPPADDAPHLALLLLLSPPQSLLALLQLLLVPLLLRLQLLLLRLKPALVLLQAARGEQEARLQPGDLLLVLATSASPLSLQYLLRLLGGALRRRSRVLHGEAGGRRRRLGVGAREAARRPGPAPRPALLLHLDDVGGARRRALAGDGDRRGGAGRQVGRSVPARRGTALAAPAARRLSTFDPRPAARVVRVAAAVARALGAQVPRAGVGGAGGPVGVVTQVVHGVLEGQRRRGQRPPGLRRALRRPGWGRRPALLRGQRVGVGVELGGRGDGGLGARPAEAGGRGLVVEAVQVLGVLQVHQGDAAPGAQRLLSLLVGQQGAPGDALHHAARRRPKAAGSDTTHGSDFWTVFRI